VSGATVRFGAAAATNVSVASASRITATSPAQAAGSVSVTVTNPDGQSGTLASAFLYSSTPPPPGITSVTPASGSTVGGTLLTIAGANFAAGASVTLGGTAATAVSVVSASSLTATAPAHAAGAVNVVVTNPDGQSATLASGYAYVQPSAIAFVQVAAATPQTTTAAVTAAFSKSEAAGNLNVVVVGWDDTTTTVQSVVDSRGNLYRLAIGPTSGTGRRQSIYYAPGIAGGATTVTVTFSKAAPFPDVRIAEYRGVSALDTAAGAAGSGTAANSGSIVTTSPNALLVGATTVANATLAAGTGFTRRIITSPNSDLLEDRIVTATGSYSATATLSGGAWVTQVVAFK
jgi:IPT/TIG domain-containing protein